MCCKGADRLKSIHAMHLLTPLYQGNDHERAEWTP